MRRYESEGRLQTLVMVNGRDLRNGLETGDMIDFTKHKPVATLASKKAHGRLIPRVLTQNTFFDIL